MTPATLDTVVGYVHPAEHVAAGFHHSLLRLLLRDTMTGQRVCDVTPRQSGANVATARNEVVERFLARPERPSWLWMIDTDMTFAADILDRLLASADPRERPVLGALCFGVRPARDDTGGLLIDDIGTVAEETFPTLYLVHTHPGGRTAVHQHADYPRDEMIQVHATGAACLLIHRDVLVAMRDMVTDTARPWFAETTMGDQPVSEDITFCLRAGAAGFPVHVHTGIRTGHVKPRVVDEAAHLAARLVCA